MRILLAEDDDRIADNVAAALELAGFAVDLKRTGAGQYQLFDAASSTVYGDLQYIDANAQQNLNAGFSPAYTLLNVCQYGPSSSYADSCDLQIESSRYKALERFVFE